MWGVAADWPIVSELMMRELIIRQVIIRESNQFKL
jgi:hypothetical protein